MQSNGGTQQTTTFRLTFVVILVILFIMGISIFSQQANLARIPPTETVTPRPTASLIPSPSATVTLTPTPLPPTSTLTNISPIRLFTLGRGTISDISRSPDGRLIAVLVDGALKWFDAGTFEQLGEVPVGDIIRGPIVFSPDSRMVVVRDYFSGILIDLQEPSNSYPVCSGYAGCAGVVFSPDGRLIAYTSYNSSTGGPYYSIGLWDVARQVVIFNYLPTLLDFRYHTMSHPAISPDSTLVAAGHSDGRVYVWNTEDGETRFILEGHAREVTSVDFSPDGRYLASGSEDGTVRLWSPSSGQLLRVITGLIDDVTGVRFSEDSSQLRIGVYMQADQVYSLSSGQLSTWEEFEPVLDPFTAYLYGQGYIEGSWETRLTFSPDGRSLVVGSGSLLVWDVATQDLVTFLEVPESVVYIAYSPDGKWLGVLNEAGEVIVWDTSNWNQSLYLSTDILSVGQAVSVSGSTYAMGIGAGVMGEQGFAFSPDSASLAVGFGGQIEVWDILSATRQMVLQPVDPPAYATRLSYSTDGQRIYAVLNRNRDAAIWDAISGELITRLDLPTVDTNVFTTTDLHGSLFVRNNREHSIYWVEIWDLDAGEFIRVDSPGRELEPLRLSPDGSLLFTTYGDSLLVWMSESGALIEQSVWDPDLTDLAISPDNTRLVVGSDGQAEVWDISGIAKRAQGSYIPTVIPLPTATPWPDSRETSTPMPDLPVTPLPLPDLPEDAISPANAVQVTETGRFGAGRIEQVRWASNNQFVVAGSLGVENYTLPASGDMSGEHVHYDTDQWVSSVVTLANGRSLAAGSDGEGVQVWDLTSSEILVDLEGASAPALSPDGQLLVYRGKDGYLHTWNLVAGQPAATLLTYGRHPVFSPDGKLVAAVIGWNSRSSHESIRVWDATSGVIVNALGGPDSAITDLTFSPDRSRIIAAAGGSAWVWDIRPGQPVINTQVYPGEIDGNLTLYIHTVTAAALSPNGWTLAVGSSENTIGLYSLGNQIPTRTLSGHSAAIEELTFSPNGRLLLSVDADGAVLLWNVSTGELVEAIYSHYGEIRGLVFQENGNLIGWQAGTTWTFDPVVGEVLHTTQINSGTILAVSPRGDWLAATTPYQISLWDAQCGELRQTLVGEAPKPYVPYQLEGSIFQGYFGAATSRDGTRLVALGSGGANVYDTQDGTLLLNIPAMVVYVADLSLDNQWLLMASIDFWYRFGIYDLHTGSNVFSFPTYPISYYQYKFSPDNRWVGAVSRENKMYQFQLWDFASHTLLHTLNFGEDVSLLSLAFSPDARLVALGQADGQIPLVDLSTFRVIATLTGPRGAVEHLAFSPDGRFLASGGQDGTIRIWGLP